ncbi:MAG: hypothetical protein WC686_01205 [Candidatus Shapirobacteria bacterium]|jgi:hypothetical protein
MARESPGGIRINRRDAIALGISATGVVLALLAYGEKGWLKNFNHWLAENLKEVDREKLMGGRSFEATRIRFGYNTCVWVNFKEGVSWSIPSTVNGRREGLLEGVEDGVAGPIGFVKGPHWQGIGTVANLFAQGSLDTTWPAIDKEGVRYGADHIAESSNMPSCIGGLVVTAEGQFVLADKEKLERALKSGQQMMQMPLFLKASDVPEFYRSGEIELYGERQQAKELGERSWGFYLESGEPRTTGYVVFERPTGLEQIAVAASIITAGADFRLVMADGGSGAKIFVNNREGRGVFGPPESTHLSPIGVRGCAG